MNSKIALVFVSIVVCALVSGLAEEQPPSVGAGILTRDGIGARALALGTAYTAFSDDTTAGYYNPAGLASVSGARVGGMYESKFGFNSGTSFQYLSAAYGIEGVGLGTGMTVVWRSDRGIPSEQGTFTASESLLLLSGAYDSSGFISSDLIAGLSIGGNLKIYSYRGYADYRARGIGFDLGALLDLQFDGWDASIGLKSSDLFGSAINWRGTLHEIAEEVPWGQILGLAVHVPDWGVHAGLDFALYPNDPDLNAVRLGAELTAFGVAFRIGLNDGKPVFGLGVKPFDWFVLDFALVVNTGEGPGLGPSLIASTEFTF